MLAAQTLHTFNKVELDARWRDAVAYFKSRSPVIFASHYYRFWEKHGFVQQSLAKALAAEGISVIWLDGAGWKKNPELSNDIPKNIEVKQLPQLPLRRLPVIDNLSNIYQKNYLNEIFKNNSDALVWIQGSMDERTLSVFPKIDIYSVFDDPYLHAPNGILANRAKLILTQNDFALNLFTKHHPEKTKLALPPVEMDVHQFDDGSELELPPCFPERVMGYVGSFFSSGFDFVLFEELLKSFPDWGFILAGRTDPAGIERINQWSGYRNFLHLGWVPREKVGSIWRCLDVNLLLYRPERSSHGAFPVKLIEALHYGIPTLATRVPKTSSLEGLLPRLFFKEEFKSQGIKAATLATENLENVKSHFFREMNPKFHLIRAAEFLMNTSVGSRPSFK